MDTPTKIFESIEEDEFQKNIDFYEKIYDRIFDVKANISWVLGRNPVSGIAVHGDEKHRIYQTIPIGNTPSFWVLYRYIKGEECVYLISIEPVDRKNE